MKIYLDELPLDGADYEGTLPAEVLELGEHEMVRCEGPIRYALHAVVVSDELLVDGTLDAALRLRCRRCDITYPGALESLAYHYDLTLDPAPECVDLTDDIREAIILAFPSYPVCRSDCKGLCSQCGTNKNDGECECKAPTESRWASLGGFIEKE